MKNIKLLVMYAMICLLSACGGGGGDPGTQLTKSSGTGGNAGSNSSTGAGDTPTGTTAVPTLKIALVDAAKSPVSNNTILRGASFFVRATLLDASGLPLPNVLVKFTADAATASLTSPSTLTDNSGVAEIAIQSASLKAVAGSVTATSTIGTQVISGSIDIQTKSAVISLETLSFPTLSSPISLATNKTAEILVTVSVDGNPAPSA